MKLVANIKLLPTPEQAVLLTETLTRCNAACCFVSETAWLEKTFGQFALQKLTYRRIRDEFGLTAQAAVRCIAKVADAYKLDRKTQRFFRDLSAQPYDDRIIRFMAGGNTVSIWTIAGRQKIACVTGEYQRRLLAFRKGEVDLMYVRGKWYIACVCDLPDPDQAEATDVLGIDLGVVNIATDSDGVVHTGDVVEKVRIKHSRRRAGLQKRGTKAAKRRLKKLSGKQRRFQTAVNHIVSKEVVLSAQRSGRAIGLEDLKGIRDRIKARRGQRSRLHNWSFGQLRQFVAYKAQRTGVAVLFVDPRNTSRQCAECGCIDKKNRLSQAIFLCVNCGHEANADINAARNIRDRARAAVNRPECSQALAA